MSGVAEFICRSEIETRDKFIKLLEERIVNLEDVNFRLRECLKWYAEEDFYHYPTGDEMAETGCYAVMPIEADKGLHARNALKELEKVQ